MEDCGVDDEVAGVDVKEEGAAKNGSWLLLVSWSEVEVGS